MICEFCLSTHDTLFGSGRFCSKKCASAFSTKDKRQHINEQVSHKMKGRVVIDKRTKQEIDAWVKSINTPDIKKRAGETRKRKSIERISKLDFSQLGKSQIRKRVLFEQNYCCGKCQLKEWLHQPIALELEHINGIKTDNTRNNLIALCPNCHSQTHTWRRKKSALVVK